MDNISEMKNLILELNKLTKSYDEGHPLVSDREWDDKYFRLQDLETKTNIVFPNSPTQTISYQVVSQLNKVTHNHPMLSLAKTKDIKEVEKFYNGHPVIAMCKMDGLTCSLRYQNGELVSAETRGDGTIGEDISHNAKVISSIPKYISYKDELIIDGEVICKEDDFQPFANEYKNPRNFAAGSIRLLDSKECSKRNLAFVAWDVIKGFEDVDNLYVKFIKLGELGFKVTPFSFTDAETAVEQIKDFSKENHYPIDGVVFKYNEISYGKSLGKTEHHFKNAIAYKFYDETYLTTVDHIEWTMGRTGVLTPVAVFKPIDIDGSTVERASLHNLSVLNELDLRYQNQKIEVFKANQIIPQIAKVYPYEYETASVKGMEIPTICPICGKPTEQVETDTSLILRCTNPNCEGKLINRLDHFCGKKGLDIKGLSEATLNKLLDWGWVNNLIDIFSLSNYSHEWMMKSGFGEKSVTKILDAIENSKTCNLANFISALGIPEVGVNTAKILASKFDTWEDFRNAVEDKEFHFWDWDGFGVEMNRAIKSFDYTEADKIRELLTIKEPAKATNENISLNGVNIVITGKLTKFKNRAELASEIEARGGKVVGSVSSKTNYLINNDSTSTSAKNKAAMAANIPILTEDEFIEKFLQG